MSLEQSRHELNILSDVKELNAAISGKVLSELSE